MSASPGLQRRERSALREGLRSLLGTTGGLAGSARHRRIGIPKLNPIILFQQVHGDWPPPSAFQKEPLIVSHADRRAVPDPSLLQPRGASGDALPCSLRTCPELAHCCRSSAGAKGTEGDSRSSVNCCGERVTGRHVPCPFISSKERSSVREATSAAGS